MATRPPSVRRRSRSSRTDTSLGSILHPWCHTSTDASAFSTRARIVRCGIVQLGRGSRLGGLMHQRTRPRGEVTGLVCAALPGATTAVAVFGPSRHVVWASPMARFVIVTIAATLCLRGGRGDRGRSPARIGGGRSARYGTARHVGPGSRARRDRPGVPYGPNQAVTLGVPVAAHRTSPSPVRCVDTASLACLVLGVDRIDHRRSHNPAGAGTPEPPHCM